MAMCCACGQIRPSDPAGSGPTSEILSTAGSEKMCNDGIAAASSRARHHGVGAGHETKVTAAAADDDTFAGITKFASAGCIAPAAEPVHAGESGR